VGLVEAGGKVELVDSRDDSGTCDVFVDSVEGSLDCDSVTLELVLIILTPPWLTEFFPAGPILVDEFDVNWMFLVVELVATLPKY
jgi:hypothetical protein